MSGTPLLELDRLTKEFHLGTGLGAGRGVVRAVDCVTLEVRRGEVLALIGESGSGKTTLARAGAMLIEPTSGTVRFEGVELTGSNRDRMKAARRRISMIFQDPYSSLNPRLTAGAIIAEPMAVHSIGNRRQRRERAAELAASVGLGAGDLESYPHQFSGGQRQRIAIARSLALEPSLIIADEPVSALDVSIQNQILNLLKDLQEILALAYLFIGHDLTVVRHFADRVAVMYLGNIVELAETVELFSRPAHPYTRLLIQSAPKIGSGKRRSAKAAAGEAPSPLNPPAGCHFHPRCRLAGEICRRLKPALEPVEGKGGHLAACHFRDENIRPESA